MKQLIVPMFILVSAFGVLGQDHPKATPAFDAELAKKTGADEYGMREYILVILKTGPNRVPAGKARDAMFAGHLANIKRLADEGKMVLAGPLNGVDGVRGLFVFAVSTIDEAKKLVATDPAIMKGEFIAEYHKWYGTAAVILLNSLHPKIARKSY
ncbi:MAG: YCII-related domain protein [Acidobacteria bacterium OLB17]|nr:MAG: YCII-related domain protein [Acidobacteria bacterium OLB17]MCZ2392031.1 YciI family protein [Acidobacteriota bacterium]